MLKKKNIQPGRKIRCSYKKKGVTAELDFETIVTSVRYMKTFLKQTLHYSNIHLTLSLFDEDEQQKEVHKNATTSPQQQSNFH